MRLWCWLALKQSWQVPSVSSILTMKRTLSSLQLEVAKSFYLTTADATETEKELKKQTKKFFMQREKNDPKAQ